MAVEPNTKTFKIARRLVRAGVSVIPTQPTGKNPALSTWKQYQQQIADEDRIGEWFANGNNLAVIGGAVSGNLLILDFDLPGLYEEFRQTCEDNDLEILKECVVVQTPSGGNHVYLCSEEPVGANDKLAWQTFPIPFDAVIEERRSRSYAKIGTKSYLVVSVDGEDQYLKCVIETRGEGGYAVTHPSIGYSLIQGRLDQLPKIDAETLEKLLHVAEQFNTYSAPEHYPEPARVTVENDGRNTPGNDYNARGDYERVLEDHGWQPLHRHGAKTTWVRPGKEEREISATTGYDGARMLYVFSTNAPPFEPGRKYSPFAVYTLLEHGGNFKSATLALVADNFGDPPTEKFKMPRAKPRKTVADREAEKQAADSEQSKQYLYAMAWAELNKDKYIYLTGDQWFEYRDGYWEYSSAEDVQRSVQEYLATVTSVTAALVGNVRTLAKSMVGPHRLSDFNTHTNWIPLKNGVLDTDTGQLLPHSPDNRLTYQAPYDYIPEADCPNWKRFLNETLLTKDGKPFQEWQEAIQEWFGYCLIADNTAQLSMMWVGEGANGKGTAARVLEKLVGSAFTIPIPIEQLHDPYQRAELYGKLVGFVDEPDSRAMVKNGNHFKAIVGGDSISARRPTEKVFAFRPMTRLVISCNKLPSSKDPSNGYYRRIVVIEWRYEVPFEKRDTSLDEKLAAELPGIFNWAMEGLARWRGRGRKFLVSNESRNLLEEYRMDQDSFRVFFKERCVIGPKAWAVSSQFYQAYKKWMEEGGEKPETERAVGNRLIKMGMVNKLKRVEIEQPDFTKALKPCRIWIGVDLKTEKELLEESEAL